MATAEPTTEQGIFILYRFFAADDTLLYIGQTVNPGRRMEKHRAAKPWWATIARITMEQHPSLAALRIAERTAIKTEKPLHNIHLNGDGPAPFQTETEDRASPDGLIGRFFHSWREPRDDDSQYATLRRGKVLEWQGHVVDQAEPGIYVVELFSWWDGCPNGQKLVRLAEMQEWTFYDNSLEMQVLLGCRETHNGCTRDCGGEVSHYFDYRKQGLGLHFLCYGCVKRYPGFRDATPLKWRNGKPSLQ